MRMSYVVAERLRGAALDTFHLTPTGRLIIAETNCPSQKNKANAVSENATGQRRHAAKANASERKREHDSGGTPPKRTQVSENATCPRELPAAAHYLPTQKWENTLSTTASVTLSPVSSRRLFIASSIRTVMASRVIPKLIAVNASSTDFSADCASLN